eukprot:gene10487-21135_t
MHKEMADQIKATGVVARQAHGPAECLGGKAEAGAQSYPCEGIDMVSFVPVADMGDMGIVNGNDIWGWVDGNREIAIHCLVNSVSFIDVTNAENPTVLAWMAGTRSSGLGASHNIVINEETGFLYAVGSR